MCAIKKRKTHAFKISVKCYNVALFNIFFCLAWTNDFDRVSVDKYERNSVITVRKAVRADSGKYKIVLTNSSGTCEGVADVVVLGKFFFQNLKLH